MALTEKTREIRGKNLFYLFLLFEQKNYRCHNLITSYTVYYDLCFLEISWISYTNISEGYFLILSQKMSDLNGYFSYHHINFYLGVMKAIQITQKIYQKEIIFKNNFWVLRYRLFNVLYPSNKLSVKSNNDRKVFTNIFRIIKLNELELERYFPVQ